MQDPLFVIEDGIPLPSRGLSPKLTETLMIMEVGQSVFLPADVVTRSLLQQVCGRIKSRHDKQFSIHKLKDDIGYRVWRVK